MYELFNRDILVLYVLVQCMGFPLHVMVMSGGEEVPRECTWNIVGDMPRVYLSHNPISRKGIATYVHTKVPVVRMCDMKMAHLQHASLRLLAHPGHARVDKLNRFGLAMSTAPRS